MSKDIPIRVGSLKRWILLKYKIGQNIKFIIDGLVDPNSNRTFLYGKILNVYEDTNGGLGFVVRIPNIDSKIKLFTKWDIIEVLDIDDVELCLMS